MSLLSSDYETLYLSYKYLTETRKRGITYDSIIAFAKKHKLTSYKNETIQRSLRRLAEHGYFMRYYLSNSRRGRIVYYVPTRKFYEHFKSVRK